MLADQVSPHWPHSRLAAAGLAAAANAQSASDLPSSTWQAVTRSVERFLVRPLGADRELRGERPATGLLPAPPEKKPGDGAAATTVEAAEEEATAKEPTLYPYLANLAVKVGARRIGLGRELVSATEQQAALLGFDRIFIKVDRQNFDARRLYDRMGYTLVYMQNRPADRTNRQTQFLFLRKPLRPDEDAAADVGTMRK